MINSSTDVSLPKSSAEKLELEPTGNIEIDRPSPDVQSASGEEEYPAGLTLVLIVMALMLSMFLVCSISLESSVYLDS